MTDKRVGRSAEIGRNAADALTGQSTGDPSMPSTFQNRCKLLKSQNFYESTNTVVGQFLLVATWGSPAGDPSMDSGDAPCGG
jgi:hypothetical protein